MIPASITSPTKHRRQHRLTKLTSLLLPLALLKLAALNAQTTSDHPCSDQPQTAPQTQTPQTQPNQTGPAQPEHSFYTAPYHAIPYFTIQPIAQARHSFHTPIAQSRHLALVPHIIATDYPRRSRSSRTLNPSALASYGGWENVHRHIQEHVRAHLQNNLSAAENPQTAQTSLPTSNQMQASRQQGLIERIEISKTSRLMHPSSLLGAPQALLNHYRELLGDELLILISPQHMWIIPSLSPRRDRHVQDWLHLHQEQELQPYPEALILNAQGLRAAASYQPSPEPEPTQQPQQAE